MVPKAKMWMWEEFGETMEKDFRVGLKEVLANRLRKGKEGLAQAVFS